MRPVAPYLNVKTQVRVLQGCRPRHVHRFVFLLPIHRDSRQSVPPTCASLLCVPGSRIYARPFLPTFADGPLTLWICFKARLAPFSTGNLVSGPSSIALHSAKERTFHSIPTFFAAEISAGARQRVGGRREVVARLWLETLKSLARKVNSMYG